MKQQALSYFTDIHLTIFGMFLFLAVFVGVVLWSYRRGANETYRYMEQLPLKDV
jgi:cbb3-type cytochrome oxidase subunit 3